MMMTRSFKVFCTNNSVVLKVVKKRFDDVMPLATTSMEIKSSKF